MSARAPAATGLAGSARIGCLVVPALPLQALLRAEPELGSLAVAVVEGEGARARIVAATAAARSAGVRRGHSTGEALALSPELALRRVPAGLREAAREAALDAAASISPRIEELAPGEVALDLAGLSSLHGDERGALAALLGVARRLGLVGRAGAASGKELARLAARHGDGLEVLATGTEAAFLGRLPPSALGASERLAETLARWGLATAGELARLPADGVGARLGEEGVRLHRLANGQDPVPLAPRPAPELFEESCELDFELASLEALLFVLRPPLERLLARLGCHGLACGELLLRLVLDAGGEVQVPVELAAPTRDAPSLLSLCRAVLERQAPGAAIRGVRLRARPAEVRREQLRIFGLPTVAPEKLATAVAKVAAIVGAERVGSPRLPDRHEPERFELVRFDPPPPPDSLATSGVVAVGAEVSAVGADVPAAFPGSFAAGDVFAAGAEAARSPPHLASLRVFRPPLAAEVRVGAAGPQAVRAAGVSGWVVSLAGPWRLELGWAESPVLRDAFDVELSDGAVYRLACDRAAGTWALLGRYD